MAEGLQFSTVAPILGLALVALGLVWWPISVVLLLGTCLGVFWYEQAYLRAGQLPPLS